MKTALAYLTVYLAWGSTYYAIKVASADFSVAGMTGVRFLIAGAIMAALAALRAGLSAAPRKPPPASPRQLAAAAAVGCVMLGGGTGFIGYAERTLASGVCALVIGCSPILFATVNRLLGGARLTGAQLAGGACATAGVALLAWGQAGSAAAPLGGLLTILAAMLCWSSSSVASQHLPMPADTVVSTAVQMLAAGVFMSAMGLALGEYAPGDVLALPRRTWEAILFLAAVGSCLGFTAYTWLLQHEPANRVSSYAYVNPAVAVLLGTTLGREPFNARIAGALALILGGVSLSLWGGRRR